MGKHDVPGPLLRRVSRRWDQIRRNWGVLKRVAVISLPALYGIGLLIQGLYL